MLKHIFKESLIGVLLVLCMSSTAFGQKVTMNIKNTPISSVLTKIQKEYGHSVVVKSNDLDLTKVVSVSAKSQDIIEVIRGIFNSSGQKVEVSLEGDTLYISRQKEVKTPRASADNKTVTGTVLDRQTGETVIGAGIFEVGNPANGTITDANGQFSLTLPSNAVIQISCIGYSSKEEAVNGRARIDVSLDVEAELLENVVVTALGIKREEKALGYAVQKVGGDDLTIAKSVDVVSSLTGKVAGLTVWNNTEFNSVPEITLRGYAPLIIIDGVPYGNADLSKIASDDIESIDVLKGATASALYGARGGNGAIMVTTKKGVGHEGISVEINSNTMFFAGYLAFPEVQHSYGSGWMGVYRTDYGVWGPKLDVGNTANMWNPYTCEYEEQELTSKGKNNFKNFSQASWMTNNNVNVAYSGKYGSFRTSLTHAFNRGQFPNEDLNKMTFNVSGNIKYKKFFMDAGATVNYRHSTNDSNAGYYSGSYIYDMVIWLGTEYDVRDYKNYWIPGKEDAQQNWYDKSGWYDNPYFKAYEVITPRTQTSLNAYANLGFEFTDWLKLTVRAGADAYTDKEINRDAISTAYRYSPKGYYEEKLSNGYSVNTDALLMADKTWGKFHVDGLLGASLFYRYGYALDSWTNGGLVIPGYYSLKNSADQAETSSSISKYRMNSFYAKASFSWDNTYFIDVTGRNDKSSTMNSGSYFYPSVSGSIVLSQIIPLPKCWDFWKIRGSWTISKSDAGVYANNNTYSISQNVWNGLAAEYYPKTLKGSIINPQSANTMEVGTSLDFFKKRLRADFTYYRRLDKDFIVDGGCSSATGFTSVQVNSKEQRLSKGFELVLGGTPVSNKDWNLDINVNLGQDRYYYHKLDPDYSSKYDWIYEGARYDWFADYDFKDWEHDPEGNIVHQSGLPVQSKFRSNPGYTGPDLVWGFNTTLSFRNWTLDFTFDGRIGGISYSRTMQMLWNSGAHVKSDNQWRADEVIDGKTNYIGKGVKVVSGSVEYDGQGHIVNDTREFAENDVPVSYNSFICAYNKGASQPCAQNIVSGTFFKLRNLSLSYSLPESVCQKLRMSGASVGVTGNNLLLWAKEYRYADPDSGKSTESLCSPSQRYLGFNIKLKF